MNTKFKFMAGFILIFVLLIQLNESFGQKKIEKILAEKEFPIAEDATLKIIHKYGNVVLNNHDRNLILIKVTASLETTNMEKAEKIFDKIDLQITGDQSLVKISSEFNDKINDKDQNLKVDIEVFMPQTISVDLDQMFGYAYIENVNGPFRIESKYGSFQTGQLSYPDNDVRLSFGSGSVGYLEGGKVEVSYGDIEIKKAGNIRMKVDYSNAEVDKARNLFVQNEGGSLKIEDLNALELTAKFSDVEITRVAESLKINSEYGSIKVQHIMPAFTSVELINSFGGSELGFATGSAFTIEAEVSFCDLKYPEEHTRMTEKITSSFTGNYKGIIGSASNPESKLVIRSNYGDVRIRMNDK